MLEGLWEAEYIDIDGHRARARLWITVEAETVSGRFEFDLQTEDEPESYSGSVTGSAIGERVKLDLAISERDTLSWTAELRTPAAYARQALVGLVAPVPGLNFGGGALVAWRFAP